MAHTTRNKEKLLVRVRRIRGQVAALEKALSEEDDCSRILQLIAGSRGAMDGLMAEVLEGHIRLHVATPHCCITIGTTSTRAPTHLLTN